MTILSREQEQKLLMDAGWRPVPCWKDPSNGVVKEQDSAVREQQYRDAKHRNYKILFKAKGDHKIDAWFSGRTFVTADSVGEAYRKACQMISEQYADYEIESVSL